MNDTQSREYPSSRGGWDFAARRALKFILLIGALSFFADFTYEGSRSILGPYLGSLGADAAVVGLMLVLVARVSYPRPQDLNTSAPSAHGGVLPRAYWVYLAGAALVAAGFADYPIIAYHLSREGVARGEWIAIFYSVAMAVSGAGSLVLGRLFDRWGFSVSIGLTVLSAAFAPLVFLGGFGVALAGAALWGLGRPPRAP